MNTALLIRLRSTCAGILAATAMGVGLALAVPLEAAATTVRAVMHAPLRILDPIASTAYITRDHGYMVYDTLVAMDESFEVRPQMADWKVSADGLVYTFTLRDGLAWHDGKPVTAEDCVASLTRWGKRDVAGVRLFTHVKELKATGATTFTLALKDPVTFVLSVLGKPSSNVPFMMPKRLADTPPTEPITDATGSGPFKFVKEEFKPGVKAVYVKNTSYVPRKEKSSWASGGKVVKVDRVEWIVMPDGQTAVNALLSGEIDYLEEPQYDLLKLFEGDKTVVVGYPNEFGYQLNMRMNAITPPFNDVKVRRAAMMALRQESFLAAVAGDAKYYKTCGAMFGCGTPLATDIGSEAIVKGNGMAEAKRLLKESGYDGSTIRIIHPTDVMSMKTQPIVAQQLLREAGFKVELISIDWQGSLAMRANQKPASEGGWNMSFLAQGGADVMSPLTNLTLSTTGKTGYPGWIEEPSIEALKDKFGRATSLAERKTLATEIQKQAYERVVYLPLGQLATPAAWSSKLKNVPKGPAAPYFWVVEKND